MNTPYISRVDVSAALNSLIYNTSKQETGGLRHLLLVDLLISAPAMPDGDNIRDFGLRELLVTEIVRVLNHQRAMFSLPAVDQQGNIEAIRREFSEAVYRSVPELTTWSVLYYRYVRAELGFSVEQLGEMASVHSRTITRHVDEGIDLLTRHLIQAERDARQAQLHRRLLASLPYSVPVRIFGRDDDLRRVEKLLSEISPRHFLISGEAGVGKTTFVQEVIRRKIAADQLDYVIWVDRPQSVEFVRQHITEILLREGTVIALRDYLLLYRVVVVVDGIDSLLADQIQCTQLLHDLSAASVFLISVKDIVFTGAEVHVPLHEVDEVACCAIVDNLLAGRVSVDRQELTSLLCGQVGGNPLSLRLVLRYWEDGGDFEHLQAELQDRLLGQVFTSGNNAALIAWSALLLYPNGSSLKRLMTEWAVGEDTLQLLQQYQLVEWDGDERLTLSGPASEFLRRQYLTNRETKTRIDDLFGWAVEVGIFEIIEHALTVGFPEITDELRETLLCSWWREGLRRNHGAQWRAILENQFAQKNSVSLELRIAYGVCLRRLNEWADAERIFESLVVDSGRQGLFNLQALALYEWSLIAQYRGDFARAQSFIDQAKRFAGRSQDEALIQTLRMREAEILLEHRHVEEAYHLLVNMPENAQVLKLTSEALLLSADYGRCRACAEAALRLSGEDYALQASLYTVVGRCYEKEGNFEQAGRYFSDALTLLERLDDPYSLARAQTNLAVALFPLKRYGDAGLLLSRAEKIQSLLRDRVGLNVTRHNRRILGHYIAC